MLRCASSFVTAAYETVRLILGSRAPYLWRFLRRRLIPLNAAATLFGCVTSIKYLTNQDFVC